MESIWGLSCPLLGVAPAKAGAHNHRCEAVDRGPSVLQQFTFGVMGPGSRPGQGRDDVERLSRSQTCLRIPAAHCARVLQKSFAQKKEGAGKTGCALHPRSRVQCASQEMRTRAYRFSGNTPAFPAQWLYGLYRALPGESEPLATIAPERR